MCCFCLLVSMKQIVTPNFSLLYLHFNDMNNLKGGGGIAMNIILKNHN